MARPLPAWGVSNLGGRILVAGFGGVAQAPTGRWRWLMGDRPKDGRQSLNPDFARVFGVPVATAKAWRGKGWIVTGGGRLDRLATLAKVARSRDPTLGGWPDRRSPSQQGT